MFFFYSNVSIYLFSSPYIRFFLVILQSSRSAIPFLPPYPFHFYYIHSPFIPLSPSFPPSVQQIMMRWQLNVVDRLADTAWCDWLVCDIGCFTDDSFGTAVHINFCATQES
jgi:hypothetical protein